MRAIDYDLNWGSHLPILNKVMSLTKGPVLELGSGLYSTPLLYWLCNDQKRKFVSIESDFDWWKMVWNLKNVKQKEGEITFPFGEYVEATYVSDWEKMYLGEGFWDVAFIDHSPSRRRIIDIQALAHRAKFVVVHDTQRNYKFCDYKQIWPLFKYRFDYKKDEWNDKVPHTTVLSNYVDLQEVLK